MGDIFRRIEIRGIGRRGEPDGVFRGHALVDSGATRTVVSSSAARVMGGVAARERRRIEGRSVEMRFAALRVHAERCGWSVVAAMVDDESVRRAGPGPDGEPIQVIVGHDYLQARGAALRFGARPEDHEMVCHAPRLTKARRRRRPRR